MGDVHPGKRSRIGWRRLVGFLVSFVVIGAGHIVAGRWRRGCALVAGVLLLVLSTPFTRAIGLYAALALYLYIPFDTLIIEHRGRPAWRALLAASVALVAFLLVCRVALRLYYMEGFKIASTWMAPTLIPGDHIMVKKFRRDADRGELVVFRWPGRPGSAYIARVVGVGRDRIAIRSGKLWVNGAVVSAASAGPCEYAGIDDGTGQPAKQTAMCIEEKLGEVRYSAALSPEGDGDDFPGFSAPPYLVPPGTVFVLGDNRHNRYDSRSWGAVPLEDVLGTASFIWWSTDPDGVRWDRIGATIR